jgi:hypothetical protein
MRDPLAVDTDPRESVDSSNSPTSESVCSRRNRRGGSGDLKFVGAPGSHDLVRTYAGRRPERSANAKRGVATHEAPVPGEGRTLVLAGVYGTADAQVASRCALDVIRGAAVTSSWT